MCDDVEATVAELEPTRASSSSRPSPTQGFGRMTRMRVPGGGELGLYQPTHPSPLTDD